MKPEELKAEYEHQYTRTSGKTCSADKKNGWWIVSPIARSHTLKVREKELESMLARLRARPDHCPVQPKPLVTTIDPF